MHKKPIILATLLAAGLASSALAADPITDTQSSTRSPLLPWYIHVGAIGVLFDSSAKISLDGTRIPGASATANNNATPGFELGYHGTDNFAISLTGGYPPTTTLTGTGPLAGLHLGRVTYGPGVLSAHYHFTNFGSLFKPYLGAGVNYTIIMGEQNGVVRNLRVASAFGSVLQAGVESDINDHWGTFLDVKKIFVSTKAKGLVEGMPAEATVDLSPLLVMAGVYYRF